MQDSVKVRGADMRGVTPTFDPRGDVKTVGSCAPVSFQTPATSGQQSETQLEPKSARVLRKYVTQKSAGFYFQTNTTAGEKSDGFIWPIQSSYFIFKVYRCFFVFFLISLGIKSNKKTKIYNGASFTSLFYALERIPLAEPSDFLLAPRSHHKIYRWLGWTIDPDHTKGHLGVCCNTIKVKKSSACHKVFLGQLFCHLVLQYQMWPLCQHGAVLGGSINKLCVNPQLKIVPNKSTIYSCLSHLCWNLF